VLLNQCGKDYLLRLVWLLHPKWLIFKDLHPKEEFLPEEFLESRWLQKWSVKLETNTFKIEEAKKAELDQDLIQKNMKSNSFVFNKGVLRKNFMKKWKNSIMISIFNKKWVNISHQYGFVIRKKERMKINYNEEIIEFLNKLLIINTF